MSKRDTTVTKKVSLANMIYSENNVFLKLSGYPSVPR